MTLEEYRTLDSKIEALAIRVEAIETGLGEDQRQRARFNAMALQVIDTARQEGMLLPPANHEGGRREGDIDVEG